MTTETCPVHALGEEYDPFTAHSQDPYPFYARARSEEPVFYSPRFGMWFATRYDDGVAIVRDPATFSSADAIPLREQHPPEVEEILAGWGEPLIHLLVADPPEHTRLRQLARDAFAPTRIAALEPMIRQVTDDLIARMGPGPADLVSQFAYPLPLTVILRVLGVPEEDLEKCRRWTQDAIANDLGTANPSLEAQCEWARSTVAFRQYVHELARQRANEPKDDLISSLVTARLRGYEPLSVDSKEAMGVVLALIIAGHETTASLIGTVVWHLLRNPDQLAEVRRNSDLIPGAVEEAVRHDPAGIGFVRTATREVEVGGVRIPAGGKVFVMYASGNHDPQAFPEPERFLVGRDHTLQLGFGRGIHYCLGAPLARLEGRIALERLLARLPNLRLANSAEPPRWKPNIILRGLESLHVAWD